MVCRKQVCAELGKLPKIEIEVILDVCGIVGKDMEIFIDLVCHRINLDLVAERYCYSVRNIGKIKDRCMARI